MKIEERNRAVVLRKKGFTYSEIRGLLKVSKGSLSRWLSSVPHIPRRDAKHKRKLASIAAGQVLHHRKIVRVHQIVSAASQSIMPISSGNLHLLGIMAYWTEGSKTQDNQVAFTNTDPDLIGLVYRWWVECCGVNPKRIRLHLRVHLDTECQEAERYWRSVTAIPADQCYKTTVKISGSRGRGAKKLRFGIATLKVCDTDLFYRIKGWIDGIKSEVLIPPIKERTGNKIGRLS